MKFDLDTTVQGWLLNGVTVKEVQIRLSWWGISMTENQIKLIEEKALK